MTRHIRPRSLVTLAVAGLLTVTPAAVDAQQAPAEPAAADHSAHQPASQPAAGTRIEELITKMQTSTGDAKVAVMADLIEQLVKERQACEAKMADKKMMPMAKPAAAPVP